MLSLRVDDATETRTLTLGNPRTEYSCGLLLEQARLQWRFNVQGCHGSALTGGPETREENVGETGTFEVMSLSLDPGPERLSRNCVVVRT